MSTDHTVSTYRALLDHGCYKMMIDHPFQQQAIHQLLQLATAIVDLDIDRANDLAKALHYHPLLRQTRLQQRARYFLMNLTIDYHNEQYGHFFRGLTPLLVDLFRLLIERHIMPQLNEFISPQVSDNSQGVPIYRGLRWNQERIEQSNNIIHRTWEKYYGEFFNYNHYVSSSHLIRIIHDFDTDPARIERVIQMRTVEKYVRNLIAHEIVTVTDAFVQERSGLSTTEVFELLQAIAVDAGIESEGQDLFTTINQDILTKITKEVEH